MRCSPPVHAAALGLFSSLSLALWPAQGWGQESPDAAPLDEGVDDGECLPDEVAPPPVAPPVALPAEAEPLTIIYVDVYGPSGDRDGALSAYLAQSLARRQGLDVRPCEALYQERARHRSTAGELYRRDSDDLSQVTELIGSSVDMASCLSDTVALGQTQRLYFAEGWLQVDEGMGDARTVLLNLMPLEVTRTGAERDDEGRPPYRVILGESLQGQVSTEPNEPLAWTQLLEIATNDALNRQESRPPIAQLSVRPVSVVNKTVVLSTAGSLDPDGDFFISQVELYRSGQCDEYMSDAEREALRRRVQEAGPRGPPWSESAWRHLCRVPESVYAFGPRTEWEAVPEQPGEYLAIFEAKELGPAPASATRVKTFVVRPRHPLQQEITWDLFGSTYGPYGSSQEDYWSNGPPPNPDELLHPFSALPSLALTLRLPSPKTYPSLRLTQRDRGYWSVALGAELLHRELEGVPIWTSNATPPLFGWEEPNNYLETDPVRYDSWSNWAGHLLIEGEYVRHQRPWLRFTGSFGVGCLLGGAPCWQTNQTWWPDPVRSHATRIGVRVVPAQLASENTLYTDQRRLWVGLYARRQCYSLSMYEGDAAQGACTMVSRYHIFNTNPGAPIPTGEPYPAEDLPLMPWATQTLGLSLGWTMQ